MEDILFQTIAQLMVHGLDSQQKTKEVLNIHYRTIPTLDSVTTSSIGSKRKSASSQFWKEMRENAEYVSMPRKTASSCLASITTSAPNAANTFDHAQSAETQSNKSWRSIINECMPYIMKLELWVKIIFQSSSKNPSGNWDFHLSICFLNFLFF